MTARSESYLDKCISALPVEKREAARAAFAEISDTGDDCCLSKLLAVLEANNTYAQTIPRELAAVHQQFLLDLKGETAGIRQELIAAETTRDVALRKLPHEEIHKLDKTLPLTKAIDELQTNSRSLGQLRESVSQQSTWLSAFCVVGLIGAVVVGMIFLTSSGRDAGKEAEDIRTAREFLDTLNAAGMRLVFRKTATAEVLTVTGPTARPAIGWNRDAAGNIESVELVFATPPRR